MQRSFRKGRLLSCVCANRFWTGRGTLRTGLPSHDLSLIRMRGGMIKGPDELIFFAEVVTMRKVVAGSFKEHGELFFLIRKRQDGSQKSVEE